MNQKINELRFSLKVEFDTNYNASTKLEIKSENGILIESQKIIKQ